MRTAAIFFVAVGVWLPGLAHAQDSTCDAEPRYLVVTVVGSATYFDGQRAEVLADMGLGTNMFDRCGGTAVMIGQAGGPGAVLADHPRLAEAQAAITVHRSDGDFTTYLVHESLHDICAVLADCADATK